MSSGEAQLGGHSFSSGAPRFLLELDPWHRVFLGNLVDLLESHPTEPASLISAPAPFWPDVFVSRSAPWGKLGQSLLYHVFVLTAVWGLSHVWLMRPRVTVESATSNTKLTYYQVSEYLPSLSSGSAPAKTEVRGQPAYSKQPIISVPVNPDNSYQTIVNPAAPKLIPHEVKLPNLVVVTPIPQPPAAGVTRSASQLTLPWLAAAKPIAPPSEDASRRLSDLNLQGRAASVVQPIAETDALKHKLGDINLAHADPQVAEPKLPVQEQHASGGEGDAAKPVPAPPPISVGGEGGKSAGQLIALRLDPVAPSGPIEVPAGNRRGVFAATPEGKRGAPGIPDIAGGGTGSGGTGKEGDGGIGSGNGGNNPAGVYVGGGPPNATAAIAGNTTPQNGGSSSKVMVAAAGPGPDVPRETPGLSLPKAPAPGSVEQEVFGPKKYYSMVLNMPNLTSAGGSWIIRFTELKQLTDQSGLTAPVAVHKVDPAYPPALMHAHVEGTVTLYAIIRADGTVDGVKVLRGLDDTLDENARAALSRWHFRPAMHQGKPVDLEAVIQIPFAARKAPF